VPTRGRVQVVVFAGPSLFRVTQGLVTGVNVNDPPPFDATTFASATVVETHRSHIGANGGVEASVRVWKALGVGAIARFSRATMPFDAVDGTALKIRAGGLQGGGGLHVRF